MKLKVDNTEYKPHPAGTFNAACVTMCDLGQQTVTYEGIQSEKHQVYLKFESDQMMDDGRHWTIGTTVTASLNKKATLRKLLEGWKGEPLESGGEVDLDKLLGAYVKLTVAHEYGANGNTYAKIVALGKPDTHFPLTNELIGNDNYLEGPDWLQEKITKGMATYKQEQDAKVGKVEELNDEVPF